MQGWYEIFNELNELVLNEWFSFLAASNEKVWLVLYYCNVESKTAREKVSMQHMLLLMRTLSFATPRGQTLCKRGSFLYGKRVLHSCTTCVFRECWGYRSCSTILASVQYWFAIVLCNTETYAAVTIMWLAGSTALVYPINFCCRVISAPHRWLPSFKLFMSTFFISLKTIFP